MNNHNPVLLLHGINDTSKRFNRMKQVLIQNGFETYTYNFTPADGSVTLDLLAKQLQNFIKMKFSPVQSIDIVAFSMGGIIARYYLQKLGGLIHTHHFVSIASPHFGTLTAHCQNKQGIIQMRPNSTFLQDLNKNVDQLRTIKTYTISTKFDLTIIPNNSCILFPEQHTYINAFIHPLLLTDDRCIQKVIMLLKSNNQEENKIY